MGTHQIIIELVQIRIQIIPHQVQVLVVHQHRDLRPLSQGFLEGVVQDLLVDAQLVEDHQDGRPAVDLRGSDIESLSLLGDQQAAGGEDSIGFLDRFFGDAGLGREDVHGRKLLSGPEVTFPDGVADLLDQLLVQRRLAGRLDLQCGIHGKTIN